DDGTDLVEDFEGRGQAGGQGVLGQDATGEAVEGGDGGPFQGPESVGGGRPLQLPGHPVAKLGGGRLGEGDGGQLVEGGPTGEEELEDPGDQLGGLPAAGPGLHEEGGGQVAGHGVPRRPVGDIAGDRVGSGSAGHPAWANVT